MDIQSDIPNKQSSRFEGRQLMSGPEDRPLVLNCGLFPFHRPPPLLRVLFQSHPDIREAESADYRH
jgi:hypothetical protein